MFNHFSTTTDLTDPFLCVYSRRQFLSPTKVQSKNTELEPTVSSPASPSSSESSSIKQTRMQRAGTVKRDLSTSRKMGRRKRMMDQEDTEPKSPMGLLEQITQEYEDEEEDSSLNEVKPEALHSLCTF